MPPKTSMRSAIAFLFAAVFLLPSPVALAKEPAIAPNIAAYWSATDEPGAAEQTNLLPLYRPGGSGMYNITKDPEAANSLFGAPIVLHLMQLWDVRATPATQPRFAAGVSGLGIKEGVVEAMKSFTNVKTYSIPW